MLRLGRAGRNFVACLCLLALAACGDGLDLGREAVSKAELTQPIGAGPIKVALLLPFSASGGNARAARALRNAADLAMSEISDPQIQILPIDTGGTTEGARAAAQAALGSNVRLVLGPLTAVEVRGVAPVARVANVPIISFSTDSTVATSGVYLLSFMPEGEIDRVLRHAIGGGARRFAALLPRGEHGDVAESTFRSRVGLAGREAVAIERYGDQAQLEAAIAAIAEVAGGEKPKVDALFVLEAGTLPKLAEAGVKQGEVQILGSGQWNEAEVWAMPEAAGAWYAAPTPTGFEAFGRKYQARFNAPPPRYATVGYDAVSLVAALAGLGGERGFDEQILTNADGFAGIDGVFRFRKTGLVDRGLAVMEIRDGAAAVRDPAPSAFGS
ncbi:penicillin-binding protein activator [Lutibaculum baratangense]|nr:penicillin-binding protein activator [Lutibaculum baratangense]